MSLWEAIRGVAGTLAMEGITEARLEAEVMTMHVAGCSRVNLYVHEDRALSPEELAALRAVVERRKRREPLAYILKNREFFGLDFYVDQGVLIPRPETELLVEQCLKRVPRGGKDTVVADIGTGCGVIAASLALHLPYARLYATDISSLALEVALINWQRHGLVERICPFIGDLASPLPEKVDILVANLPYIPTASLASLDEEIQFEPRVALDGGVDGLEVIGRFLEEAGVSLKDGGLVLLEIGAGQGSKALLLAEKYFSSGRVYLLPDWQGLDRVVIIETKPSGS